MWDSCVIWLYLEFSFAPVKGNHKIAFVDLDIYLSYCLTILLSILILGNDKQA